MNHQKRNKFSEKCYSVLKKVPRGKVTTYGEIARAVGNAMKRNPYAPEVPCHRVVRSDGKVGGFALGTSEKIKMLRFGVGRFVNLEK
ncbi:MAG: MGMT family protein [Nanoarchaeota archaeon]|nr:MGMT family protein [Nanoarchaeota archaeon]MBU1103105.1 MGMT family protein [Nanoarchaeota archaeon]